MKIEVVYEDEHVLAVVKPAGVVVNKAETVQSATMQDWAEQYLVEQLEAYQSLATTKAETVTTSDGLVYEQKSKQANFLQRVGLAHRLDKETSGILLFGKNPEALYSLMQQFKLREIQKRYLALVHGYVQVQQGFIQLPIARSEYNRMQYTVDPFGKPSYTEYSVQAYYVDPKRSQESLSLVSVFPKTGRTHQIRVHMKHLGHPLVADELYLNKKRLQNDVTWCGRHFLHAAEIQFFHPVTKQAMQCSSELPADLSAALNMLQPCSV